jgi:pyruvate dehydrogenase E1 component beta subunit
MGVDAEMSEMTMVESLNLALDQEMESDERVLLLGEDVGEDGGIFRVSEGLNEKYGPERVIDTPLAESAIVGTALGMALGGLRPVAELQFMGFSYFAMHQIESHVSRYRWRSQGGMHLPMVIRMPYGAGVRALEHHSESKEVFYAHIPGLKTVIPSGPRNARALLASAIRDPDPVIFLEPKWSYRSFREDVPEEPETVPIGTAELVRRGEDLTFICYGAMLRPVLEVADGLADRGVSTDVLDLRTVAPLDVDAIEESIKRTGRAVVVTEAHRAFGPASEIVASIVDRVFFYLEAPVERVTGYDVHVPYFAREFDYLPDVEHIERAAQRALEV